MILLSLFVTIAVMAKSSASELPNLGLHNFLEGERSPNNAPWHDGSNSDHGRGNGRGFDGINGNTSCNPTSNDIADQDCPPNHWCRLEAGTCPQADVEQEGTCEPLVPFCRLRSMIWTCGCDGNWYKNPSCTNGVNVQDDSKCPPREDGIPSLRTPVELLQESSVNSECVRDCTSYFQGKDPNSQPNSQNAPDYCHNNEELYGVDFNQCMKDYKEFLESIGSVNGHVGYWCTNRICKA